MNENVQKWVLLGIRALLTVAFASAGIAKLMGVEMMVQTFDAVGFGQWFRYVTGVIELGSAIALWVPSYTAYAAGLLVCTMIGALVAHATVLGLDTALPAAILGLLAATTLYANRDQLRS